MIILWGLNGLCGLNTSFSGNIYLSLKNILGWGKIVPWTIKLETKLISHSSDNSLELFIFILSYFLSLTS